VLSSSFYGREALDDMIMIEIANIIQRLGFSFPFFIDLFLDCFVTCGVVLQFLDSNAAPLVAILVSKNLS